MKIVIGGASGLVGQALKDRLENAGHQVLALVRGEPKSSDQIAWKPNEGQLEPSSLAGVDAVVHLSGESIAEGRWTKEKKERIRQSRVKSTSLLAEAMVQLPESERPKRWVSASAVGYYGDRADARLTEDSPPGKGFLPEVCQEWEDACQPAAQAGVSVVNARFGVVLSPKGGALAKMLPPFRMGLGGKVGSGKQYMSWISLPDVVSSLVFLLEHPDVTGPVNVTAPFPATNAEFTNALGDAISRPTVVPMPAFACRLAFGEMADALLLCSAKVIPEKLQRAGFEFAHPKLQQAFAHLLSDQKKASDQPQATT